MDKELLKDLRDFVKNVYEFRPIVPICADSLIFGTIDYYAMEDLMKRIDEQTD